MTTTAAPSPQSLCLPAAYRQQPGNLTLDANRDNGSYWSDWRIADSGKWQFHVYRWAADLITRRGVRSVLDVGCGVGTKLARHIVPVCADVEALDQSSALAVARRLYFHGPSPRLTEVDLERPALAAVRTFDLILCADVIEHLVDPDPALNLIRSFAHDRSLILLSTPERDRERGRDCMASSKPEHVREWSRPEFNGFVRSRGFTPIASRLFPKDDAPIRAHWEQESRFRLRQEDRSKLCCQALLCRKK